MQVPLESESESTDETSDTAGASSASSAKPDEDIDGGTSPAAGEAMHLPEAPHENGGGNGGGGGE